MVSVQGFSMNTFPPFYMASGVEIGFKDRAFQRTIYMIVGKFVVKAGIPHKSLTPSALPRLFTVSLDSLSGLETIP